jgi:undecaprenyl pyrophosphate phosphatase UppP
MRGTLGELRVSVEAWMLALATIKGAIMAVLILAVADTSFLQALAVAACSAVITGAALIIATWMQNRHTAAKVDDVRERVEGVAEKVDAPAGPTPNGEAR